MHVLVTGAAGYVGRGLVQRLLGDARIGALTLVDQHVTFRPTDSRVRCLGGDLSSADLLAAALSQPIDLAFHLASVPGGLAEREPELGRRTNLDAMLALFDGLAQQATPARVVFASTIGVYGLPTGEAITARTLPCPPTIYGAHKWMGEVMLADLTRRGRLDARSLRLPGIVARPAAPTGHGSAFMSDLIRQLGNAKPYVCPVSPQAVCWWMSLACCIDNLLHAAQLPSPELPAARVWQLPVLRLSVAEVIAAFGDDRRALVSHAPQAAIESLFGRMPALDASEAEAMGFRHDGSVQQLVRNALPHL